MCRAFSRDNAVSYTHLKVGKHFQYLLSRLRIVALIALVEDVPAFHQRQFDRRGTDIDPQRANGLFLHLFHSDLAFAPAVPAKMNTYIYSTVYYLSLIHI